MLFQFTIRCREFKHAQFYTVAPGKSAPFWPQQTGSKKFMVASIADSVLETQPFEFTVPNVAFLRLDHEVNRTRSSRQIFHVNDISNTFLNDFLKMFHCLQFLQFELHILV